MIGVGEFFLMLAGVSPGLILWIAVVIFAIVMLRRGGGRAERFLIAGAGVKIIGNLLGVSTVFLVPWLVHNGNDPAYISSVASSYSILLNIISMAGIICLVYAFWVKFKTRDSEGAVASPRN